MREVEIFWKLDARDFWRDDHIGKFDFQVITNQCDKCLQYGTPSGWDPRDFPDKLPMNRVIHLYCKSCDYSVLRFVVMEYKP